MHWPKQRAVKNEFIRTWHARIAELLTSLTLGVFILSLLLSVGSCKEPLPNYRDPSDVFDGQIQASYFYSPLTNALFVKMLIKNIFDETLDAPALFTGSLHITLARDPTIVKTFELSSADLIRGKFDSNTGILTIESGETIEFAVSWNFVDDNFNDLGQNVFQYRTDPTCPLIRRIARQESFSIRGTLNVFDQTKEVKAGPVTYSLCYVKTWVDRRTCPSVTAESACAVAGG